MDGIEHTNSSESWQDRNSVSLETNQGVIHATTFGNRSNGTQVASLHAQHSTINIGAQQQHQKDSTEIICEFLHLLSFEEMNFRENDIKDWTPETCTWLYEHAEFRNWLIGLGLLTISGKPGSGKSTIMKFIINEVVPSLTKASDDIITASFFFSARGATLQHTALGMFRSLLHQLIKNNSAYLLNLIVRLVNLDSNQRVTSSISNKNQLRSQLKRVILELLNSSPVCLYVDALDECDEDSMDDIRLFFEEITDRAQGQKYTLGICVSCRPYPNVIEISDYKIVVDENNTQDIERRIQHQFQSVKMREHNQKILKEAISSKATGVFQWVDLVLPRILELHEEGKGIKPMLNKIDAIPQELENLYSKALAELDDAELTASLRLFAWTCFAERLLSLDELRYAIVFDINLPHKSIQEYLELEDICEDAEQMERRIRHLSKGLIEVKQQGNQLVAQFIHQSASDFVQKNGMKEIYRRLRKTSTEDTDPIAHAHFDISRSCIRFMLMEEALKDCENQKRWQNGSFPVFLYSFLDYATLNWAIHAERAEARGLSQVDLLDHFQWPSAHLIRCWSFLLQRVPYKFQGCFESRCANVGYKPYGCTTLLHVACAYNLVSVITKILEISQDSTTEILDRSDYEGNTALHIAVAREKERIKKTSLETDTLMDQCGYGFFSMDLDFYTGPSTRTFGVASTIKLLLDHGANIAAVNDQREIPLYNAIRDGNIGIIKQLLPHGGECAVANANDETPLHVAAMFGRAKVVKLLLDHGADFKCTNWYGRTPLHFVTSSFKSLGDEYDIVELLTEHGADYAVADEHGMTPLLYALQKNRWELVELLLNNGANVTIADEAGWTPLHHIAFLRHSLKNAHRALELGADLTAVNNNGMTPLHIALMNGDGKMAMLLLDYGADITIPCKNGKTPLHYASSPVIVRYLLEHGADLKVVDKDNMTPLHIAAYRGSPKIVELLLKAGSDINVVDKDGKTPRDIAIKQQGDGFIVRRPQGYRKVLQLLDKAKMRISEFLDE